MIRVNCVQSTGFIMGGFLFGTPMAYQVGEWIGGVVAVLLLTAALLKCVAIARRPATNVKCVVSLMLVLGSLLISSLLGIVGTFIASDAITSTLRLINALAALCLLLGAIVVGILGLTECQDRRSGYKQGPAQAMWALGTSAVLITLAIAFSMGDFASPTEWFRRPIPTGPPGTPLVYEDFNFRFRTPGAPWSAIETNAPDSGAKLRFARSSPVMSLVVSAEKYGEGFSSEDLLEAGKARLRGVLQSDEVLREKPMTLAGLSGTQIEMRGTADGKETLAIEWSGLTNGFGYHLLAQGPWRNQSLVSEEASNLFALFECIDLKRITDPSGVRFLTNFVSARYGYEVEVANSEWRQWQALQREFAWFDFAARREAGFYMAVVPVWLGEEVSDEALRAAMLSAMAITYPDPALSDRKSVSLGLLSGVQFDYERYSYEIPFRYRLRILQGGGYAYLLCVWAERNRRDYDAAFEEALGRIRVHSTPTNPPDIAKLPYKEKATRAMVLNQAGLACYREKNYTKAQSLFAAAHATDPQPLYFENTVMAWSFLDQPEKALAFIEEQAGAHPNSRKLQAYRALFLGRAGKPEAAVGTYEKIFADGYQDLDAFTDYVHVLTTLKRYDDALAAVHRELQSEDALELRLLEPQIYREKGDFTEAIRLLKIQREKAPFVPEVGHLLAMTYIDAGQFENARALCLDLLKTLEPSWETYFLKGRSEVGLEQFEQAKASFEKALRLSPGEDDTRKILQLVSGFLGEGNNSAAKQEISPVEIPSLLTASLAKAAPEGYGKEYGAYYSRRITAIEFDKEKGCKKTDFGRVHILDTSGASSFSSVEISFDPLSEEIYVNSVRVMESGGNVVTGKVSQFYITDDQSSELATHGKKLVIPVSGLRPGSVLEFAVTRLETGPLNEMPFLDFMFSRGVPVWQSIVFLKGTVPDLKFKASPSVQTRTISEGRYWLCENPIVIRPEPLRPSTDQFVPMLWMGDGSTDWTMLGKRYYASIEDRLRLNAELREQARRLTQDLASEDEKIAVLARHVQTNYLYKGLEFGRRGRMPALPEEVAHNKYGDCKDHAVMLQQMLQAAGIPARLALVNTEADVQQDLPSLDQFDHMIVYVPGRGNDAFIDCTQKGALLGKGPPHGLAGRQAFIVDRDKPRFEPIPNCPKVASEMTSTRAVHVLESGEVRVEETFSLTGVLEAAMRQQLMEVPDTVRRMFLQAHLKEGQAELETWGIEDLEKPAAPLRIKLVYKLRNQFHKVEARLLGAVPALLERYYLSYDQVDKRLSPFELKYPIQFTSKVSLTGPDGWRPQAPANPDQSLEENFLQARSHQSVADSELRIEFSCRQKPGRFPPDQYSAFREAVNRAMDLVERRAALEPVK